jgi:hypothetical protein
MIFKLLTIVSATILSSTTVFVVTGTYAQNMTVGNITGAENMTSESEGRIATESDDTGSISQRTREFPKSNNP